MVFEEAILKLKILKVYIKTDKKIINLLQIADLNEKSGKV